MDNNKCNADLRRYLIRLYGGMFAGLVFLASIAACFGLASNINEMASLLFCSLSSATLLFAWSQLS